MALECTFYKVRWADLRTGLKQKHRLEKLESLVSSLPLDTRDHNTVITQEINEDRGPSITNENEDGVVELERSSIHSNRSHSLPSDPFPVLVSYENLSGFQTTQLDANIQQRARNSSNVTGYTTSSGIPWLSSQSAESIRSSFSSTNHATAYLGSSGGPAYAPSQAVSPMLQDVFSNDAFQFSQPGAFQQFLGQHLPENDSDTRILPEDGQHRQRQFDLSSLDLVAHDTSTSPDLGYFSADSMPVRGISSELNSINQPRHPPEAFAGPFRTTKPEPSSKWPHQTLDPDEKLDCPGADLTAGEGADFAPANLEVSAIIPSHPPRRPTMWPTALLETAANSSDEELFKPPCPYKNHLRLHALTCLAATLANAETLGITADMYFNSMPSPFYQPSDSFPKSSSPPHIASALAFPNIKRDLRPMRIQLQRPHASYLDLLIFPLFRNWVIELATTDNGLFEEEELLQDLMNDGLVCWGNVHGSFKGGGGCPWDMRSWEAKRWFLEKWWGFVDAEVDDMWSVSRWWWEMHD